MKFSKILLIILLFPIVFSLKTVEAKPQGLSIDPPKIDIKEGTYIYDVNITNYDNYDQELNIYVDKLSYLGDQIGKRLDITKFTILDSNNIILKSGETRKLTLGINPDIKNSDTPLYGDLIIVTKNKTDSQATINHGIAVPIFRNLVSSYLSKTIQIKNIKFEKGIFDSSGKTDISFDIVNTGDAIAKIYGEYDVRNNSNDIVSQQEFSSNEFILKPGDSQTIKGNAILSGFFDKFKLSITVSDNEGDVLKKEFAELIYVHPLVIVSFISIITLTVLLFAKGKSLREALKKSGISKKLLRKAATSSVIIILIFSIPVTANAQGLSSPSYSIPESDFSSGIQGSSTSYRINDEQSGNFGNNSTSTSYATTDGIAPSYFAFTPPAATVTNNSGAYYDRLKIVVNSGQNPTDTDYAVHVTSPSFAGTKYVKSSNILGSTLDNVSDWRRYSSGSPNWGGATGTIISGLSANTSYTFYVKARHRYNTTCVLSTCNIPASETAIVLLPASNATPNTTVSTAALALSFQVIGVTAGGSNNITTTSTAADFGTLSSGTAKQGSNTLRVTTNAISGYNIQNQVNQKLQTNLSKTIDWFTASSATYASPQVWTAPTGTYPDAGWIGYHTDNTGVSQFQTGGTKFAPFPVSPSADIVVTYSTPQTNVAVDDNISYKIEINTSQPAGKYTGMVITYLVTGFF